MSHITLLQNAFQPLNLSPESHDAFFSSWSEAEYARASYITEAGKKERYFYVVVSGVQAVYILDNTGEKKIIGFSFDGSFSGVYDSYLNQSTSHYFLEALTPSKLLRANKKSYDSWFNLYPEFNYWGRIAHQNLLIGRVQREIELITLTAKQRFDTFMQRCPKPLLNIPQKYLASYLNMTPETFSRLRALKS